MRHINIHTTQTILEEIKGDVFEKEYVVKKDAALTLVFVVKRAGEVDIRVRLAERGSHAQIFGFIIGNNESIIRLKTLQLHEAADTTSNLLVKNIVSDSSFFSYDGGIEVEKHAQKTDAYQRNENLLLSNTARAESKPKLEIRANDVRCTHGATTGMLSKDELWYLSTRGMKKETAESLLTVGFFEQAITKISDIMQQESIRRALWQNL